MVITRATGIFSVGAFEEMLREILADSGWKPGMDCLVDHSMLDLSDTTTDDIRSAADIHKRYDTWIGNGKIAVVLGREADYELGLLYANFLGSDVLATVRAFGTPNEGRQWLAGAIPANAA